MAFLRGHVLPVCQLGGGKQQLLLMDEERERRKDPTCSRAE